MKSDCYVVDKENGEIVTELFSGDRILRGQSTDYLNSKEANADAAYVKLFLLSADMLSRVEKITAGDLRVCLRLLPYIRYDTGIVAYNNGEPINLKEIEGLCKDMSESTVKRALENLVEQDIFVRCRRMRQVYFIANPYIFMRGAKVNKTLANLFRKSRWGKLYNE